MTLLADTRVSDATLRQCIEAAKTDDAGFVEFAAQMAAELLEWREKSAAQSPTVHEVAMAQHRLSGALTHAEDPRRYGVNCALRVLEAVERGSDADAVIAEIVGRR